jgi:hypothetical protein
MTTCYFQPAVTKHDNLLLSISSDETWQLVTFNQQELLTLPEHLSSPPVVSGVRVIRSLVLCVCFVDRCFSFCTFSFGHCVVCSSSICGFWLPIWHLQTFLLVIVLSVLLLFDLRLLIIPLASPNFSFGYCVVCSSSLRFTTSDYPFGISKLFFWLLCCLFFFSSIYDFWLPLWHLQTFLLVIVLSVLLRFRTSDYLWYLQTLPWLME